jgi:hypothetical protein
MAITKVTNDLQDALAASQPTITSVGTLTGFTSTGIDDNATSTAITIDASENVGIGNTSPNAQLHIGDSSAEGNTTNPAIQIGGTTTYRLGMYTSAEGAVIENKNGDDGIQFRVKTAGEAMRIDGGTGNVGIGVAPEDSYPDRPVVRVGSGLGLQCRRTGNPSHTWINSNVYQDASSAADKYIGTDEASQIKQANGAFSFNVAASGTAGSAITWTTAMAIDNGGRVSIGRSSDVTAKCLELQPPAQISDFGSYILNIGGDEADDAVGTKSGIGFGYTSTARPAAPATIGYETKNTSGGTYGDLYFATRATSGTEQPTERMSIDSNGNILSQFGSAVGYGQTSGSGGMCYRNEYGSAGGALIVTNDADTGWSSMYLNKFDWSSGKDDRMMQFSINGNGVGYIRSTSSGTSFVTSSDYRLKENVVPMTGSIDRVKALKPSRFNFTVDADTTVDGFLAHEAQAVVPECVTGTKDAMRDEEYEVTAAVLDDEGLETTAAVMGTRSVPDMQGIDQSKLVPLLVAALQEAIARIEILEGA